MSIFNIFKKPEPPPIYKRQPIATAAVILTVIGMFVLGPIGAVYQGMTEELKGKADNKTVILLIEQIKENDQRQWKEIEKNREQQPLSAPKNLSINTEVSKEVSKVKVVLTPSEFETYMALKPEIRKKYKSYLEGTGKDTSGLPD